MLQTRQNLKHNLLIKMHMMKLFIEKKKLSLKHQIQLRSRNFQAKKMKIKNTVNGDTCRSLLNDVKSLSFLIENDQEKLYCVFSVLQNLKEVIECDLPKEKGIPLMPKRLSNSSSVRRLKNNLGRFHFPNGKLVN